MSQAEIVAEKSKIEVLKEESRGLRGTIHEEINDGETGRFSSQAENLLKFHGMYQQKDRDRRKPGDPEGPKPFTLMIRGRIPGGRLRWDQYLAWDQIADKYAANGLRLTTRQSIQLHGVLKHNVKATIREIHEALSSTTGACGDVVRNVAQPVNPWGDPKIAQLDGVADLISKHFEVESNAYFEIFLDKEVMLEEKSDRIYGNAYLPRKFKIGVTVEGNNSIDAFTQDLTFVATFADDALQGYFVLVGGGMGMSHNDADTHPRLADNLGWIPATALIPVAEAVVTTQRDFGNRDNRTFARLKYLLDSKGVAWFKSEVESRSGQIFEQRKIAAWKTPQHLGWTKHRDGTLSLGFHSLSGRIADGERPLKSAIRDIVKKYKLDIQVTAEQDLILYGIPPEEQRTIEAYLDERGLSPFSPRKLYDRAMTCVALPTCSKAFAEAERVGPEVFSWLQASLDRYELNERAPTIRITGCPNGCARPYSAEIGLVGQLPNTYALFIGGDEEGLRLALKVKDKVKYADLPEVFEKITKLWAEEGEKGERLGDFAWRYGAERLGAAL